MPSEPGAEGGRFDLVVRFGDSVLILVEAKPRQGRVSDRPQLDKYLSWLRNQRAKHRRLVYLVGEPDPELDTRVVTRRWAEVCMEFRLGARRLCRRRRILEAAMTLAFCAAIEQNLLGFPAWKDFKASSLHALMISPSVIEHLESFLGTVQQ